MIRRIAVVVLVVLLPVAGASAESYIEDIKDVDAAKKTITFPLDGKETVFRCDDKVEVRRQVQVRKKLDAPLLADGLKALKAGTKATITTEKRAGEEVVTKIVVLLPEKK